MEAKEIEEKAIDYAGQFEERYQLALFKAFMNGAEWMQEQCHKDFLEASAEIEKQHVQDVRDLQEQMIMKACEWWSNHATEYLIDIEPDSYKPPRYIISLQAKIDYVKEMEESDMTDVQRRKIELLDRMIEEEKLIINNSQERIRRLEEKKDIVLQQEVQQFIK